MCRQLLTLSRVAEERSNLCEACNTPLEGDETQCANCGALRA